MWVVVAYVIVLLRVVFLVHCSLCVVVRCCALLVLWCGVVLVLLVLCVVCWCCVLECVVSVLFGLLFGECWLRVVMCRCPLF